MGREISVYDHDIKFIKEEIIKINRKLDEIIQGPIFKRTLSITDSLDEKVANNLKSLNNMILQVKGIVSQVNTLRGRKSDWDGAEVNAYSVQEPLQIS
jgi:hypothetical protein